MTHSLVAQPTYYEIKSHDFGVHEPNIYLTKVYKWEDGLNLTDWFFTINTKTFAGFSLAGLAGTLWGTREIYHAYPRLLQNFYNAKPQSWIGEEAWKRNYVNNDPTQKHKLEWFNSFRDIHHGFGLGHALTLTSSVICIWNNRYPKRYKWINTGILLLTRATFSWYTYNYYSQYK